MDAKEIYLWCVKEDGLSEKQFSSLTPVEQSVLEKGAGGKYRLNARNRSRFKVVLTGGVFDILHIGHVLTLQKARGLGDLLVVVVTTDGRVEQVKKRKPIHTADYRCAMVSSIRSVDLAIVGADEVMKTFERVKPDVVAFGYDQKPFGLPAQCKSVHLREIKADESLAKTSKIIRELGL